MSSNIGGPFRPAICRPYLWTERTNSGCGWTKRLGRTKPAINIKVTLPNGFYNEFGVQVASSPAALRREDRYPTGLDWSTPRSGNSRHQRVRLSQGGGARPARDMGACRTNRRHQQRYVDLNWAAGVQGNYAAYVRGGRNSCSNWSRWQVRPQGVVTGVSAMYAPPELNRVSQYYEARLYGIGLFPSRPRDMVLAGRLPKCLQPLSGRCRLAARPTRA